MLQLNGSPRSAMASRYAGLFAASCLIVFVNNAILSLVRMSLNRKRSPYSQIGNFCLYLQEKTLRVIAKKILREFWGQHEDSEQQLKSWFNEAEKANWSSPADIKLDNPSASILVTNRVVFNIKGNSYRLIVKINYKYGIVWIRFIGTHAEYSKINAETV